MVDAESGEPLGAIALVNFSWRFMRAETGYWLAAEARGHGYASRAVRLIVRWAFDQLQLWRMELRADPHNLESQRVAERCGFQQEGRLRSHMVVLHSGERRDSLIYGLLPGELA